MGVADVFVVSCNRSVVIVTSSLAVAQDFVSRREPYERTWKHSNSHGPSWLSSGPRLPNEWYIQQLPVTTGQMPGGKP